MSPDIQKGHIYVCMNLQSKGAVIVPLWSIAIPEKVGDFVSFQVIEPEGNSYSLVTGYDNFVHLFKPIKSIKAWLEH